jgi:O-antigen ligase
MFTGTLMRVGLLLVVTGLTFILMGWIVPVAPFLMIIGSGCAAVAFENQLAATEGAAADLGAAAVDPTLRADEPVVTPAGVARVPEGGTGRAA